MRAYVKTVTRSIKTNFGRFIAMTAIILLGVCFVAGLGSLSPKVEASVSDYLAERNAPDIIVKAHSASGFSAEETEKIRGCGAVADVQTVTAMDMTVQNRNARIYVFDLQNSAVNKIELQSGRFPETGGEILVERASDFVKEQRLNDVVSLPTGQAVIVGIAANPLLFARDSEPDVINGQPLELIVYLDSTHVALPLPVTDVYVRLENTSRGNAFSAEYRKNAEAAAARLKAELGDDDYTFLTAEQNKSFAMLQSYTEKVDVICLIFPIFFIAVAALVVLTTMTRMVEEERGVLGCYRSLGYGNAKIAGKYIGFSAVCCILGAAIGCVAGVCILPAVIYPAFDTLFFIPPMSAAVSVLPGVVASFAMLLAVVAVTAYVILRALKESPAALLQPKAPKAGKKVFLEKIPFLWKRLKFKYKSTLRNVLRYCKHLLMTVVSVAGSTALVLAGLGLYNVSQDTKASGLAGGMGESFSMISVMVILFAAALCVLVIYNLTNMNISERTREIATLKVLGYRTNEVTGYIYREIFIMALLGVLAGLPLGAALLYFVFTYVDFGSIASVKWYSYLLAAALTLVFVGIVDLLLYNKIKRVDMNASLKTVE